jgi:hypothetical protein
VLAKAGLEIEALRLGFKVAKPLCTQLLLDNCTGVRVEKGLG